MTIKPIKSEEDYKAALAEINRVFYATEGTEDFDRLDVLATLVEAYEAKHCPIAPPVPSPQLSMRWRNVASRAATWKRFSVRAGVSVKS